VKLLCWSDMDLMRKSGGYENRASLSHWGRDVVSEKQYGPDEEIWRLRELSQFVSLGKRYCFREVIWT